MSENEESYVTMSFLKPRQCKRCRTVEDIQIMHYNKYKRVGGIVALFIGLERRRTLYKDVGFCVLTHISKMSFNAGKIRSYMLLIGQHMELFNEDIQGHYPPVILGAKSRRMSSPMVKQEVECQSYSSIDVLENNIPLELKKETEDDDENSVDEMEEEMEFKPELVLLPDNPDVLYTGLKKLTPQCLDEVAAILDESGKIDHLAELLDLSHLLHTGIISNERSVSRNILQYATEKDSVNILDIRNFLEVLDEARAVGIMDRMARELQAMIRS